ncbi:peptidoglycan D,D-transpeptidase FtsI family protein [Guptibacillus algicola]|uniref:peptidoglycan D,D-transpeptidase FtsI family protein n=1 Tax=Guptibacillus algicola TaxID=225844 RepID=UPI001CD1A60C|nr:penicillin-binding protein 2 [Alkalihalobacillus algicola]MCA0985931.1 penicillin-binding protein 2 [Alkalihalobacillus algicola]
MIKKNIKKSHVPFRLNILFLCVFLLFSALVLRLGVIQIVQGEDFERLTEQTENVTAKSSAPRGKMFDRYGRVLVDNEPTFTLTYIRTQNTKSKERLEVARKLATFIDVDTDKVTERDLKDYWILTKPEKAKEKLSDKEWSELEPKAAYQLQIDRIKEEDLKEISDDGEEMKVAAIKRQMDTGYALSSQSIKKGLTREEIATVSEHLDILPGVDIQADAERIYPYGESLETMFGNLGPIPEEQIKKYTMRGYDHNDQVGVSYLEKEYEELLKGQKAKKKYITDKSGKPIGEPIVTPGKRGNDLVLTVNIDLQQELESILAEKLSSARAKGNPHADRAYAIAMDPSTGDILAFGGTKYSASNNKYIEYSYGTLSEAYEMGSSVKGASVLTGYETGVIGHGTILYDAPIRIPDTKDKASYKNMGNVNDLTALKLSSNVYMFRIAMMIAGYDYQPNTAGIPWDRGAYDTVRYNFNQFGLGKKTGIDMPIETSGINGGYNVLGKLMDLMIGQFDTYTPLQMAQYVSTIANGGKRIQPHFLKEVHEPSNVNGLSNIIVDQFDTNVLNTLQMSSNDIERVKSGMRLVTSASGGTAANYFNGTSYTHAGKTGTAQVKKDRYNLSFVGFAPYDNPEIAISVIVPNMNDDGNTVNKEIARELLDAYFDLKDKPKPSSPVNSEEEEEAS